MKDRYVGSCHCGAVAFEADIDLADKTYKCSCSICTKGRFWHPIVKPENFRMLRGENYLSEYQFGPKKAHHMFCKTCGIHVFGWSESEDVGGKFYTPKLACLDNADPTELATANVTYVDGRNDDYTSPPAEVRHL